MILRQYTDPERLELAEIASVYLNKSDTDNVKRPLRLIRQRHDAFLKSQFCRFTYRTSVATYAHLATYSLAAGAPPPELRASQSLRASKADEVFVPADALNKEETTRVVVDAFDAYHELLSQGEKPQVARYAAPQGVMVSYTMTWSFLLLAKHFFPDRLWVPGAMLETHTVAKRMWEEVHKQDPELWDTIYEVYGLARHELEAMKALQSMKPAELAALLTEHTEEASAYNVLLEQFGSIPSMWS